MAAAVLPAIGSLLIFGSANTLTSKWQFDIHAEGINGVYKKFEKPWWGNFVMFLAMALVLPIYFWEKWRASSRGSGSASPAWAVGAASPASFSSEFAGNFEPPGGVQFTMKTFSPTSAFSMSPMLSPMGSRQNSLRPSPRPSGHGGAFDGVRSPFLGGGMSPIVDEGGALGAPLLDERSLENRLSGRWQLSSGQRFRIVFFPALFDLMASVMMLTGLLFINASVWQMLRGGRRRICWGWGSYRRAVAMRRVSRG